MTLKEVISMLPNGFHDSYLVRLEIDFPNQILTLDLDVWMDRELLNGKFPEKYQMHTVKFKNVRYIHFDPECFSFVGKEQEGGAWIDAGYDFSKMSLPKNITLDENSGWIFFQEFNCFIYFSSSEVTISPWT